MRQCLRKTNMRRSGWVRRDHMRDASAACGGKYMRGNDK
jgi:hypothetical protein